MLPPAQSFPFMWACCSSSDVEGRIDLSCVYVKNHVIAVEYSATGSELQKSVCKCPHELRLQHNGV